MRLGAGPGPQATGRAARPREAQALLGTCLTESRTSRPTTKQLISPCHALLLGEVKDATAGGAWDALLGALALTLGVLCVVVTWCVQVGTSVAAFPIMLSSCTSVALQHPPPSLIQAVAVATTPCANNFVCSSHVDGPEGGAGQDVQVRPRQHYLHGGHRGTGVRMLALTFAQECFFCISKSCNDG